MQKIKRLLVLASLLALAAFVVLCMKAGYPFHRVRAFVLLALSWLPLGAAWYLNRRRLRVSTKIVKKKTRPWMPYIAVATVIALFMYTAHVLAPVKESSLAHMSPAEITASMKQDIAGYLMVRQSIDDLLNRFKGNKLLSRDVSMLTAEERSEIHQMWREGVVLFLECDMLKEKYGGFHQVDYTALPQQHSDAFFIAYATFIIQYSACLNIYRKVNENRFMEALLNESVEEIPAETYSQMKKLLLKPAMTIRANAGALYYELVKKDISFESSVLDDFESRRSDFFKTFVNNPRIYLENPIDVLEDNAFKAWFPLQKQGALLMSHIRTSTRDFLITPGMLAGVRGRFQPGDILLQRRNWYMTNIGIPGFWPHAALYIGSWPELKTFFGDESLKTLEKIYPDACARLQSQDDNGFSYAVMEAIKDGVILQSLEKSAHCDCLAVIRPRLSKETKLKALACAFSHYGKPYDMNFDFATDSELVCSELVYKAYNSVDSTLFAPEIVNGRILLPPNLMAEQISLDMSKPESRFEVPLFFDAVESEDRVFESTAEEFIKSYKRSKWYVLQ